MDLAICRAEPEPPVDELPGEPPDDACDCREAACCAACSCAARSAAAAALLAAAIFFARSAFLACSAAAALAWSTKTRWVCAAASDLDFWNCRSSLYRLPWFARACVLKSAASVLAVFVTALAGQTAAVIPTAAATLTVPAATAMTSLDGRRNKVRWRDKVTLRSVARCARSASTLGTARTPAYGCQEAARGPDAGQGALSREVTATHAGCCRPPTLPNLVKFRCLNEL